LSINKTTAKKQKTKQKQNKASKSKTKQLQKTKKNVRLLSILNRLFITTNAQQAKNYLSKTLSTHKI